MVRVIALVAHNAVLDEVNYVVCVRAGENQFSTREQMPFSAFEQLPRRGEMFNNFARNDQIEFLVQIEVGCVAVNRVITLFSQAFDLILFVIHPHQIRGVFAQDAMQPYLACLDERLWLTHPMSRTRLPLTSSAIKVERLVSILDFSAENIT